MVNKVDVNNQIAKRVAQELRTGDVVNLGIGIPTLVADHVPPGIQVYFQTENGLLGVGPTPEPGQADPNLVNAGKFPVTEEVGASYFSSADSFAMIRGGHVDIAVLGVLQIDRFGRIANYAVPGKTILGVGGAMDLLVGARKIVVATTHVTKDGKPKIVSDCTYPLSGTRKVDLIVTEYAVFSVQEEWLVLEEIAEGTTLAEVQRLTEAPFELGMGIHS
ncbi:3-oxoacid CoA-transferase subunit B [Brevibacillus centrosporus]|uniref:3-oxoacid CoA-transferase subunit B n=1 Tax=Brevibacillus centrosporus TaxID=54910 RepID=UPI002E244605|nr:3-oxoacid CoA-transferase subunit B [Brevibacillus centrosporus]